MRTKKLRLGIVMAAMSAVVGGSALGVAQSAIAWAGTGLSESPAAVDTYSPQAPVAESFATAAVFDWT